MNLLEITTRIYCASTAHHGRADVPTSIDTAKALMKAVEKEENKPQNNIRIRPRHRRQGVDS